MVNSYLANLHVKKKNEIKDLMKTPTKNKAVGVALLSVLLLSGCGDSSLPPLFGGSKEGMSEQGAIMANGANNLGNTAVRTIPAVSNNKNLFGQSLRTDDERLSRLERSVQSLRNDFDTVQPSIRRLMAVESDIQELIGELKQLSNAPQMASPTAFQRVEPAPAPYVAPRQAKSKPTTYMKKSAPPVQGGKATIFDVRSGEHPGKTRLVLDSNTTASYSVDIDNNENIMVIDLQNANWTAPATKRFPKSSIISSYSVEQSGNGSLMVVQLKRNARVGYKASLPSNSGSGKRIVIDVSPL